jgi:general secretion pathway protein I
VRGARGFTLVEVLVALAIVTIGMAAVLGTLSTSANTISYMRDKTFAQWVGLNKIANLRLSGQMTHTGNSEGDTDFAGRKWHWRQEVNTTEIPGVVRIDVRLRPADVKGDDEHGWFTTVSGIQGDAVGAPNGFNPSWGAQVLPGQGTVPATTPGTIGSGTGTQFGAPGTLGAPTSTLGGPSTLGGSGSPDGSTSSPPPPDTQTPPQDSTTPPQDSPQ